MLHMYANLSFFFNTRPMSFVKHFLLLSCICYHTQEISIDGIKIGGVIEPEGGCLHIILYLPNLTIIAESTTSELLIVPIGLDILTEYIIIFIITV